MGFLARSASFVRYHVKGSVETPFWDAVREGVASGAFRKKELPGDEIGAGWVSLHDFDDSEFAGSSFIYGNYVALSYRLDVVRIPARVLEVYFKNEQKKLIEQSGRSRLSLSQARSLKETIKESLKAQAFPSIQVVDVVWDTTKSFAYVGTLSPRLRERVEDHFKKSFGLTLVPMIPFIKAEQLLGHTELRSALEQIQSESWAP